MKSKFGSNGWDLFQQYSYWKAAQDKEVKVYSNLSSAELHTPVLYPSPSGITFRVAFQVW